MINLNGENNDNIMDAEIINNNNVNNYESSQGMNYNSQQMDYNAGQGGNYGMQQGAGYGNQQMGNYPQNINDQMNYNNQQMNYNNGQFNNYGMQQQMNNNQYMNNGMQQGMNNQYGYQNQPQNIIPQPNSMQQVGMGQEDVFSQVSEYKQRLRGMKEVQSLTSEIEIQNPNSIVMFGQKASENISKVSDQLLNSMKAVKSEEASEMLVNLTKIMDKFDIGELENVKEPSIIQKLIKGVGNSVAKLFQKYDTMGYEVEKVYVLLKKYENDIKESNENLKRLYDANLEYYQLLEKYIVAGEIGGEEIDTYINQISNNPTMNPEEKQMMLQKLEISKDMLSQRVYDLQIAENVAIQAAPMIQTIVMSNFNLMRKINSSFIVTLPIFKQCLAQAIILKRQEIQAKSIKQLDDKTNELIMRNASNTARQSVAIAQMASGSSIALDTLEKSYATIMKGIEETKAITEVNRNQRKENSTKLESLKVNMKKNISGV